MIKNKYDVAKVISLFLVVFAHSSKMFSNEAAISNFTINGPLSLITSFIYSFHMPVFIAISGSVYSLCVNKGKYQDNIIFFSNKVKRLLLPYIFFSFFVVGPTLYVCRLTEGNYCNYMIENFILCLNNRHLWYVIVLFLIFIIFRLIGRYLDNKKYFLLFLFFVLSISPYFSLLNYLKINKTLHMLLYFYLGYLIANSNIIDLYYKKCLTIGALFTVFFWILSLNIPHTCIVYKCLIMIVKQFGAISGIFMIYGLSKFIFDRDILCGKITNRIIKDSYGIYLFHPMIIYLLTFYLPKSINCYFAFAVIFFVSFCMSDILTETMRIFRLNAFIGEFSRKVSK